MSESPDNALTCHQHDQLMAPTAEDHSEHEHDLEEDDFFNPEEYVDSSADSEEDSSDDSDEDADGDSGDDKKSANPHVWNLEKPNITIFPSYNDKEKCITPPECREPYDFFKLIFTEEVSADIVNAINQWAALNASQGYPKVPNWKELTVPEFSLFVGAIIEMACNQMNTSDIWEQIRKPNYKLNKYISMKRFYDILAYLRFGDDNVESLMKYFNKIMLSLYAPGENLMLKMAGMLDRSLRGIRRFKETHPRHTHSIRYFTLETPNGITVQLYTDKGQLKKQNFDKIVGNLLKNYLNTGRHIFVDRFYCSVKLADYLLQKKTHMTGYLGHKSSDNPLIVTSTNLIQGGTIYRYNEAGVCVCKWKSKGSVLALSTKYGPEKEGDPAKPKMMIECQKLMKKENEYKDRVSHIFFQLNLNRYKKAGLHIIGIMIINAYLMYKMKIDKSMDFFTFGDQIVTKLLYCQLSREENITSKQ